MHTFKIYSPDIGDIKSILVEVCKNDSFILLSFAKVDY